MSRFAILSLLIFSTNISVLSQKKLVFAEEYIDFAIDSNSFIVNGVYVFENLFSEPVIRNIAFPFGVSSSVIDSIRILDINTQRRVQYRTKDEHIEFTIAVPPEGKILLNIYYTQPIREKNIYILTSTQTWQKPLKLAKYALTIKPKQYQVNEFSYSVDSSNFNNNGQQIYYWTKKDFMPDKDFEVTLNNKP